MSRTEVFLEASELKRLMEELGDKVEAEECREDARELLGLALPFHNEEEAEHLLERVRLEAARCREPQEVRAGDGHGTSAQVRPRTSSGTMRFQPGTSEPEDRRASKYLGWRGAWARSGARCLSSAISDSRCCSRK